jgi:hypothetical protein
MARNAPVSMRLLGVKSFRPIGTAEFRFDHIGLNRDCIVAAPLELKAT